MTTTTHQLSSLDGIAVQGVRANPSPGEVFLGGTISGDRMVLSYQRTELIKVSNRRHLRRQTMRLVSCERSYHDGDFVWLPVSDMKFTTETSAAPRNRHAWFVPAKTITK